MRKLTQTRLHNPPEVLGNCFPAVIACFLDLDSPEDAIQIQEEYNDEDWVTILDDWLIERGFEIIQINGHQNDDSYYLVTGMSPRGVNHVCIYQNGELYHDPHPSGDGLLNENNFETIIKLQ